MRQNIRECKLLLMVLATALLSTACSSSPQPAPPSALPSVSFPAPQRELGISDNLAHLPEVVLNQRLALLQDVGVKWVRKDIEWRGAEREQGKYDWSVNDSTVATISRMGIKPLLILSYAPQWAAGEGQTDCAHMRCSPADTPGAIDAFGAFARAAVKHYCAAPYNVHTIEIWNEPNLHKYWPNPNPATYVKVLKAANQAIKSSGCDVQILMGGLGDTQCTGCLSSSDF